MNNGLNNLSPSQTFLLPSPHFLQRLQQLLYPHHCWLLPARTLRIVMNFPFLSPTANPPASSGSFNSESTRLAPSLMIHCISFFPDLLVYIFYPRGHHYDFKTQITFFLSLTFVRGCRCTEYKVQISLPWPCRPYAICSSPPLLSPQFWSLTFSAPVLLVSFWPPTHQAQ